MSSLLATAHAVRKGVIISASRTALTDSWLPQIACDVPRLGDPLPEERCTFEVAGPR